MQRPGWLSIKEVSMAGDDFYLNLRQQVAGYSGPYADYVLLIPDLFILVSRLVLDKRVDAKHKAYLGAALAYVVSPIDLLPERTFGVLGYIDDVIVLVATLNMVLNEIDGQIIREHWSGSADLLETVRKVLAQADQLIGRGRLEQILDFLGIHRPTPGQAA
jgi:uncharacterized membrane protein YkvA (DUF1232 family)